MINFRGIKFLLVLVTLFSLVACGGGNPVVYAPSPDQADISRVQGEVKQQLNSFRGYIREGRFEPAASVAEDILTRFGSRDQSLEAAIYTDLCLCALADAGDMAAFNRYSAKLRDATSGRVILPRDTQFVLELSVYLNSRTSRRDPRIAADLSEGIDTIFK